MSLNMVCNTVLCLPRYTGYQCSCLLTLKEAFYAKLESVVDQCPMRYTFLVLGEFNASTVTDRDGYETCVGLHGSGTGNQNSTNFLDFARSHGLRVTGSWFQRPQAHRWTLHSNAGGVAKEIDHVLVDCRWKMIQNCRVYRSAQFLNTDHRLVVATLKLHLKSIRMVPSQPRLDVGKLNDERVAEEFANKLSGDLGVWLLWEVLKSCGVPSRPPSLMLLVDVLELTVGQRRILSLKGHWILLTRVAGPS